MSDHVLITGGAGFIGSPLADELLRHGHRVRALDDPTSLAHGPGHHRPRHLAPELELVRGDVRDPAAVAAALRDVSAVYHFAARLGVGQTWPSRCGAFSARPPSSPSSRAAAASATCATASPTSRRRSGRSDTSRRWAWKKGCASSRGGSRGAPRTTAPAAPAPSFRRGG